MSRRVVPGNRWHELPVAHRTDLAAPSVSLCVPYAGEADRLARSLVGFADVLEHLDHVELVIADGRNALTDADLPARTTVVRGPFREGSTPSASRNAAAAAATGDVLVFVDADIVVDHDSIGSVVRWFCNGDSALVLARLRFVDIAEDTPAVVRDAFDRGTHAEFLASRALAADDWRERYFSLTDQLRCDRSDLFRIVTGGVLAVRADDFDRLGGFLPIETRGVEDVEFGYRCWAGGLFLIPEPHAVGWHQGLPTMRGAQIAPIANERGPALARLIPVGGFRKNRLLADHATVPFVPQIVTYRSHSHDTIGVDATAGGDRADEPGDHRIAVLPYAHVWLADGYHLSDVARERLLLAFDRAESGVVEAIDGSATVLIACTNRALAKCGRSAPDMLASGAARRRAGAHWTTAERLALTSRPARSLALRSWRRAATRALSWIHRRASAIDPNDR